jgi:signal peptidase I
LLPYDDVHRGDIIVFRFPVNIKETYMKRVMCLPGDRIHLRDKQVFLNGHLLNEPYVVQKSESMEPYRDNFPADRNALTSLYPRGDAMLEHNVVAGDVVVPANNYFAMGDNRDNSSCLGRILSASR